MKRLLAFLILIAIAPFMIGCQKEEKADIYVSIYPLQYVVEKIVGDNMTVKSFYPYGTDIHEYEPSPASIINMATSKAIFYIGAGLEAFIEKAEGNTLSKDILVKMSNYVPMIEPKSGTEYSGDEHGDHNHPVDPHIWLDPNRMITVTEVVFDRVCTLMPDKVDEFTKNKNELVNKLEKLDQDFKDLVADENIIEPIIVVDHDAYLYWEDAYGIKRIKTRLDNDSCTVIPSNFIKNVELIKQLKIKYITITQNESVCDIVDQYVKEAGVEKVTLYGIGLITKADLKAGRDYLFFMNENLRLLGIILPRES